MSLAIAFAKHERNTVETVGRAETHAALEEHLGLLLYSSGAAGTELPGAWFMGLKMQKANV